MRYVLTSLLLVAMLAHVRAQPAPTVAPFFGDRVGALSLTFDDGSQNQVDIAVPLLEEFGLKATFFVVTGPIRDLKADPMRKGSSRAGNGGASWEEWRAVAKLGHEIGNHSKTHTVLRGLDDPARLLDEIDGSARLMAEKLGAPPLTFCYPGNARTPYVRDLVLAHHILAREECYGYGGKEFTAAQANAIADRAIAEKRWLVGMLHGVGEGYSPVEPAVLREHFAYLAGKRDALWVDTFANIARYQRERETANLLVRQTTAQSVSFTLSCPLDTAVYHQPLTVIIPAKATQATATRLGADAPLPVRVQTERLLVDVAPGAGTITVTWE